MALVDELIGTRHPCTPYVPGQSQHHYDLLREADEFRAAAGLYPDEEDYLLDHAFHRYQSILDLAAHHLDLPVDHLIKSRVTYRPYSQLVTECGWGTQAFTSEAAKPDVVISELSFADIGLLQLLLVHEMQHATDFAFYHGLTMGIIERELRARVSVAQALRGVQDQWPVLYQQAMLDEAYWLLLTFWLPDWPESRRAPYWELLEDEAKARLQAGLYFSPTHIRALLPELKRAEIDIDSGQVYWVERHTHSEAWELAMRPLDHEWHDDADDDETGDPAADGSQRNTIGGWHLYGTQYAVLQEQAARAQEPNGVAVKAHDGTVSWQARQYAVESESDTDSQDVINTLRSFLGG